METFSVIVFERISDFFYLYLIASTYSENKVESLM